MIKNVLKGIFAGLVILIIAIILTELFGLFVHKFPILSIIAMLIACYAIGYTIVNK